MSQTIQLNLALLLPHLDATDSCVHQLSEALMHQKGIEQAHIIVREDGTAELCLHFDPNRISLSRVQRLAEEAGAELSDRYRHEQIPFGGLDAVDAADTLSRQLAHLPGVLHANANYAAELAFVAYDSTIIQRPAIEQAMRGLGARLLAPTQVAEEHAGHGHGSAPAFLPHWMQERWTLILVALAGLLLLIGWLGERFFGLPPSVALGFYILAYIAGGYDIATHAIPGLFKGKFDTDVLMLAAAAGAAILGEWAEGAFLLFCSRLATPASTTRLVGRSCCMKAARSWSY